MINTNFTPTENNRPSNVSPETVKLSDYMTNNNQASSPISSDTIKPKSKSNTKMILGVIVLLIITLGAGVGLYLTQFTNFDLRQQAWLGEVEIENNANEVIANKVEFDKFAARESDIVVGNVKVTVNDLEKLFSIYYEDTSNESLWKEIAEKIVHEAALQDFASREGFLENISQNFDPGKAEQARTYFEQKGTNHVSGEVINLWFYNTEEPAMGVDAARAIQKERIDIIHAEIKSGKITMTQAAEKIKAMSEIGEIDPSWVRNAYFKFEYTDPDKGIFNDPKLNKYVWDLEIGEVSEVLVGQDFDNNNGYDAYFSIIKLYEKETNKESDSVEEVIEKVEIN